MSTETVPSPTESLLTRETLLTALGDMAPGLGVQAVVYRPYHRTQIEDVFAEMPGLAVPAVLLVRLDREDSEQKRTCNWAAMVIHRDEGGDAADVAEGIVDGLIEELLGKDLGALWVRPQNTVRPIGVSREWAVFDVRFSTQRRVVWS